MEPPQESIVTQYRIANVEVIQVYEREERWYVQFEGSWECLCLGPSQPNIFVGDHVDIIIRKCA